MIDSNMSTNRFSFSRDMDSKVMVFCDFDGTITKKDTTLFLLERFANASWLKIEKKMLSGEITEEEGFKAEISMLSVSWEDAINAILNEVEFEPTFPSFYNWLQEKDIPFTILSGGFREIIGLLLSEYGIEGAIVKANELSIVNNRWQVIPIKQPKIRGLCNHCKSYSVLSKKEAGYKIVYIGDGLTDRCPAGHADVVFAKDDLEEYCKYYSRRYIPFRDFDVVKTALNKSINFGKEG